MVYVLDVQALVVDFYILDATDGIHPAFFERDTMNPPGSLAEPGAELAFFPLQQENLAFCFFWGSTCSLCMYVTYVRCIEVS